MAILRYPAGAPAETAWARTGTQLKAARSALARTRQSVCAGLDGGPWRATLALAGKRAAFTQHRDAGPTGGAVPGTGQREWLTQRRQSLVPRTGSQCLNEGVDRGVGLSSLSIHRIGIG